MNWRSNSREPRNCLKFIISGVACVSTLHSGLARGGLGHFGVNFFIAFFGVFCILYIHINMEKSIKNKINIVKVLKITHFWGTNAHFTL